MLHGAAGFCYDDVADLLIRSGADVQAVDKVGAILTMNSNTTIILSYLDLLSLLLSHDV